MAIITLTSDIGRQDFLTGAIKGELLQINPNYRIIDISHDLTPFNYPQAGYMCRSAFKSFPSGTLHIVLINLFDKQCDHLLLAKHNDQYIGIADNGLITMILEKKPEEVIAIPIKGGSKKNILSLVKVFANAFEKVLDEKDFDEIGNPNIEIEVKNPLRPKQGPQYIEGQILFVDNFENVIINITRQEFEEHGKGRKFKILFTRDAMIEKISETYGDVPESEKLALFNAAGYLEIAVNKGNAAGLFGLEGYVDDRTSKSEYLQNRLLYQTVKILFE